jgi:hypothetical protein
MPIAAAMASVVRTVVEVFRDMVLGVKAVPKVRRCGHYATSVADGRSKLAIPARTA